MDETSGGAVDSELVAEFDWATTEPSTAVVETVADTHGGGIETLPPLYESVDPDGLDALFVGEDGHASGTEVSFRYADRLVTVRGSGQVRIRREE